MKALTTVLFGLSLSLLTPALAFAEEEEQEQLGCVRGDCENGEGSYIEIGPEGRTEYRGHFRNGRYHGFGRLEYVNEKAVYKGYWKNGKRDGRGIYWDRDNNVYMGQWKNDRRNGQGSQFYNVEDWREDKYTENWLKHHTENYTGEFKNDVFFGQGTYRWADGTTYTGGWAANKKHGDGYFDYGHGNISRHKYDLDRRVFGF